jgi:beta-mannosidase
VMTLVAAEDGSRPIWPGCPSTGWHSGVHRLTGLPNGQPLVSVAEAEAAQALMPASAADTPSCSFEENSDYQNPAGGKSTLALSKEKCCERCWADRYCVVGVFAGSKCWIKYDNTGKVHKVGATACVTTKTPHPPPKPHKMETHGPYNHGNGWMSVNISPYPRSPPFPTKAPLKLFDPNTPITVVRSREMGITEPNTFASEFGCSVFSSFESMAPTLAPKHWGVHGGAPQADCRQPDRTNSFWRSCKGVDGAPENVMAERNYPCDPLIIVYFGAAVNLDTTGEFEFKRQLFLCMLGQAIEMKADIETRRASNSFGTWVWQLNEIVRPTLPYQV